jgi:hypothetical protein
MSALPPKADMGSARREGCPLHNRTSCDGHHRHMAAACRKCGLRAWLAIGNNASRGRGTPDPAERNVGGSLIDVNVQPGHGLEAESPPVVPAGVALALFSHLRRAGHLRKCPRLSRARQTWGLPRRFGVFSFLMDATPVTEVSGLKKIPVQRGTCGPQVNSPGIRSAGAPPQV